MPDNDRVSIDNLTTAPDLSSSDVMPVVHEVSGVKSTFKATLTAIGTFINKILNYSADLQTTNKTVIGAINELHNGGGGGGSSNANIAPDYDSTATYVVGDWCIYNETLYQCNTAITIAEAFDPSHWTAKKIVDAFIDTTDYYGSLLPMSPSDPDKVADRITALESGKADTSALAYKLDKSAIKYIEGSGQTDANGILTATGMGVTQLDFDHHIILAVQSSYNGTCVNVGQYNKNFYFVCTSASGLANPIANTTLSLRIIYMDKWW
jgi:hypothetical protein